MHGSGAIKGGGRVSPGEQRMGGVQDAGKERTGSRSSKRAGRENNKMLSLVIYSTKCIVYVLD